MKISLMVPCFNEEKSIRACIESCLKQSRPFDEIIFVDDSSTDATPHILGQYSDRIIIKKTPRNTGKKSSAQEFGLKFVTGDVFVTTDADTLIEQNFVEEMEKSFSEDPNVIAVAGCVHSLPYNWLTLCRAFDYVIGQGIHKVAQNHLDYIFVMPGAASAFRTEVFKSYITFDHDTITEDLDFTYKLHRKNFKVRYNSRAISYTQDPSDLNNYINQMRRWFGGGWQNLMKHYSIVTTKPARALELSLIYAEGLVFSVLIFLIPMINFIFGLWLFAGYFSVALVFASWAAWKEKRPSLILAPFPYTVIMFINAYIYLEQFVKEIILKRKNLIWFKPERMEIKVR